MSVLPPAPSATVRDSAIDNVKAVLIFLVVFGHLIELHIEGSQLLRPLWIFLYSFHMPMFALVSGMFSHASLGQREGRQIIRNVVAPLLAFELIYEATEMLITGKPSVYATLIAPYWMLWYLLSLLSWRLMLPLFARLRFGLLFALALAMLCGYSEQSGYLLSLSRSVTFFPYFLLGSMMRPDFFQRRIGDWRYNLLAAALVTAALVICFRLPVYFDYRWLYGSFSLNRLGMANLTGSAWQLLQYVACTLTGLAVLQLLTRRPLGLARFGRRSLYIFLWHGMALIVLQQTGLLPKIFQHGEALALAVSLLVSAAIVWLAASDLCERWTRRLLLEPADKLLAGSLNHRQP